MDQIVLKKTSQEEIKEETCVNYITWVLNLTKTDTHYS